MKQPNILIVMTDHQRAETVMPQHPARTPHAEKLARDGVSFTQTFCPSPHCCPSRATFFTGLYPSRHGVWNNLLNRQALSTGLNPGVRLWSEDLRAAGYDLHFAGKWHVSAEERPADRGWTEHFVSGVGGQYHGVDWEHYEKLATQPEPTERKAGEILRPGYGTNRLYGEQKQGHTTHDDRVTQIAVDVLGQLKNTTQPWCLWAGLISPHDPYIVPKKYLDLYRLEDVPLPPNYKDDLEDKPRIYQRMRRQIFGQLSPDEVRDAIRHYWAFCTYIDDLFGEILTALDATGQAGDTLVLFCSDHGDYCGEHGLFAKGIPAFNGAYHVPAIMRWPNGIGTPGRQIDEFVSLADFGPTFLDSANIPAQREFSGASLLPFLRDVKPNNWRDDMHTQCNGVELYYTQRSVRTKEWKYVFNGFDDDELYNLEADPHEMKNLANDAAYENIKREMCARLWRFARREDDTAINPYIMVGLAPFGPAEGIKI